MYWSTENEERLNEILKKHVSTDESASELLMELWREGFDIVDKSVQKVMIEKMPDPRTFVSDNIEAFKKKQESKKAPKL